MLGTGAENGAPKREFSTPAGKGFSAQRSGFSLPCIKHVEDLTVEERAIGGRLDAIVVQLIQLRVGLGAMLLVGIEIAAEVGVPRRGVFREPAVPPVFEVRIRVAGRRRHDHSKEEHSKPGHPHAHSTPGHPHARCDGVVTQLSHFS